VCSSFAYDPNGNLNESSLGATISGSNCDTSTSGADTTYGYQGDSGVTSCGGANGELCTVTVPDGTTTKYSYDGLGELSSIKQPGGNCGGSRTLCTSFTYLSGTSQVATEENGKAQTDTYSYDDDGNVTQILSNGATSCTYSSGHCFTETYDADGNVTQREDKTGTTTYTYDDLGRLTSETLPGDADACPSPPTGMTGIIYTWDAASNLSSYCDAGGTVTYTYDPGNRFTGIATESGSCTAGSVVQPCSTYGYNNANELTGITWPTSTSASETLSPENNGSPGTIVASSGGTNLVNLTYSYELSSNDKSLMQSVDNSVSGIDTSYSYNSQEELTAANETGTGAVNYSYGYTNENLTSATTGSSTTYLQYANDDALCATASTSFSGCSSLPSGAISYSYDDSGNQTSSTPPSGTGESISYDPLGQTTSLAPAGGSATTMAYTGVDSTQRTQSTTGGVTTNEAYNIFGLAQTSTVTSVTGGTLTTDDYFTYEPNGTLASMLVTTDNTATSSTTSNRYYYLLDGTNDVVGMMNSSGSSVASYSYTPFGTTTSSGSEASANPFRFQSGYQDPTGLYKFGTRYYNPSLYSWTQPDPDESRPAYAFAGSDPINNADPTGMLNVGEEVGIGLIGLGLVASVGGFLLGAGLLGSGLDLFGALTSTDLAESVGAGTAIGFGGQIVGGITIGVGLAVTGISAAADDIASWF